MIKVFSKAPHFSPANVSFTYTDLGQPAGPNINTVGVKVTQDVPVGMPKGGVFVAMRGRYRLGKIPGSLIEHKEMQKDWNVVHSYAGGPTVLDFIPMNGMPIVVCMLGILSMRQGILASHVRTTLGDVVVGKGAHNVFLEFMPSKADAEKLTIVPIEILVKTGSGDDTEIVYCVPHAWSSVIGWKSIDTAGHAGFPRRPGPIKWYIDCEFEDSTKTLLSLGIVNERGDVQYAWDPKACGNVKEQWVIENVIPHMASVPGNNPIHQVGHPSHGSFRTFSEFIEFVWKKESMGAGNNTDLEIHVDFSTDVEYVSRLFHLGMGERIRPMTKLSFIVDYVDSYPTRIENAVRHNAAWDALVFWEKVGAEAALYHYQPEIHDPHHDNPNWPDGIRDTLAKRAEKLGKRLSDIDEDLLSSVLGGTGHSRSQMFRNSKLYVFGPDGPVHVDPSTLVSAENLVPVPVDLNGAVWHDALKAGLTNNPTTTFAKLDSFSEFVDPETPPTSEGKPTDK